MTQLKLHPKTNPEIAQAIIDFESAANRLQELHDSEHNSLLESIEGKKHDYYAFSANIFYIDAEGFSTHRCSASLTPPDRIIAASFILRNVVTLSEQLEMREQHGAIVRAIELIEETIPAFLALNRAMAERAISNP